MAWKNLPDWLKGGVLSSIIFIILLLLALAFPDIFSFAFLLVIVGPLSIPLGFIFKYFFSDCYSISFESLFSSSCLILIYFSALVGAFILGAILGMLYKLLKKL